MTMTHSDVITAVFLRAHLRLLLRGLKNSRMSGTDVLARATRVTGNAYKRGQYGAALDDLNAVISLYEGART